MTDSLEKYSGVLDEQQRLQAMLSTVTDVVRPLIEQGLQRAAQQIAELEIEQSLIDELTHLGRTSLQALDELDSLSPAVDLGIFSQEDVDARRFDITNNILVKRAISFVGKMGLAKSTITELVTEPDTSDNLKELSSSTGDNEKTIQYPNVRITVQKNGVQIGQRGKFIKLSSVSEGTDARTNYSRERLAILKTLITSENDQDNPLLVQDLWTLALPDDEFDGATFSQVRVWLEKLTYARVPLVRHNGARGPSSGYYIANPNVTLVELTTTHRAGNGGVVQEFDESGKHKVIENEPEASTDIQRDLQAEIRADEATDSELPKTNKVDDPELTSKSYISQALPEKLDLIDVQPETPQTMVVPAQVEVKKTEVKFPLNHAQASILAELLEVKRSILTDIGLPPFDSLIADNLRAGLSQAKLFEQMAEYENNIDLARFRVIKSISQYFNDANAEQVIEDVSNMSEKDFRYELFSYMIDCDQDERDELLMQLAATVPQVTYNFDTIGSPRSAEVVTDIDVKHYNPDGSAVGIVQDDDKSGDTERRVTSEDEAFLLKIAAVDNTRVLAVEEEVDVDESTIIYPAPTDEIEPYVYQPYGEVAAEVEVDSATTETAEELDEWLAEAKKLLVEQLEVFELEGILSSSTMTARKISTLASSAIMGTQKMAERGVANGIIGKEASHGNNKEIEIWQWLLMAIQNRAITAFNTRQRTGQISDLAKDLLAVKMEEIESKKTQVTTVG